MAPYSNSVVPYLRTAQTGPLNKLESHILERRNEIEQWFREQWILSPAPFYTSVDLRNAGFKVAPVDTNIFPAGFNNLDPDTEALCVHAIQTATERLSTTACGILLITEDHTRNLFYWDNIARLKGYFELAGFKVKIGSLSEELTEPSELTLRDQSTLTRYPVKRDDLGIFVQDFRPCLIVLNNDTSSGFPEILENSPQPVVPPAELGWSKRLKSQHFRHFDDVSREFAEIAGIDPWLINPIFTQCGEINFKDREGEDCLSLKVAETLLQIKQKYQEYDIKDEPFVFVKSDAGTYGMNIMVVKDPEQVRDLNRKQRNKMDRGKDGHIVRNVLVQEGVYTHETWDDSVAEPVVYMIDHFVVGGFYRVHANKRVDENLNAPGMHFEPLAFADDCINSKTDRNDIDCPPNRFYTYGVVARLATLAAARERLDAIG